MSEEQETKVTFRHDDGSLATGRIVARYYASYGERDLTIVVETGEGEGNRWHVPEDRIVKPTE